MKITYLGTAAAEGWPALFCNCEYCKNAKKLGGKNIRTRSQALINNDLLIDFPADSYMHMLKTGYDMSAVKHCFVTHSHIDHFEPTDLVMRIDSCYAHNMTEPYMHFYGNAKVMSRFDRFVGSLGEEPNPPSVTLTEIEAYQTVYADNYRVTPLRAYHAESESAFIYLVEDGEKILLYDSIGEHRPGIIEDTGSKVIWEAKKVEGNKKFTHFEINHFADCIINGKKPVTDGETALKSLKLIWKLYDGERLDFIPDLTDCAYTKEDMDNYLNYVMESDL